MQVSVIRMEMLKKKEPTLTVRSIISGILIGILLTPCNVYSGLKIGWSFNMSILSALLAFGFWKTVSSFFKLRPWSLAENTYSQTAASAAASIISGGLVAPIPAYTMITGKSLPPAVLIFWVFIVSILGVFVAVGLRQQMLIEESLPFPAGTATAETVKELHEESQDSSSKLKVLGICGFGTFALKLINDLIRALPKIPLSSSPLFKKLGLLIDPSFLMLGFGMIMGFRPGLSLLLGAIICWGGISPWLIQENIIEINREQAFYFGDVVGWTLWPGVAMMVTASLASFVLNLFSMRKKKEKKRTTSVFTNKKFLLSLGVLTIVLALAQNYIFAIPWYMGVLAVGASLVLGIVASRVSGETGIPPIGALGKITQLTFGLLNPGNIAANLMTANVTGGAAGQSSDLLHDLKAGLLLKVSYYHQMIAQIFGILTGSFIGSFVYLLLIPDPKNQLLTAKWPAPAVATWKSVAELLSQGADHFPPYAQQALLIGCCVGLFLAVLEKFLPKNRLILVPSPASMGLAFIIPAWTSITMFLGALLCFLIEKKYPLWAKAFLIVIAAGFVAGESMGGVVAVLLNAF